MLDLLITKKPRVRCPPDRIFIYSNTNYALLALIIEKVSGISYQQYLQNNRFTPEMDNTFVCIPEVHQRSGVSRKATYCYARPTSGTPWPRRDCPSGTIFRFRGAPCPGRSGSRAHVRLCGATAADPSADRRRKAEPGSRSPAPPCRRAIPSAFAGRRGRIVDEILDLVGIGLDVEQLGPLFMAGIFHQLRGVIADGHHGRDAIGMFEVVASRKTPAASSPRRPPAAAANCGPASGRGAHPGVVEHGRGDVDVDHGRIHALAFFGQFRIAHK